MLSRTRNFGANILRYSIATAGPIASAVAQFVLSLLLLRTVEPAVFGSFSFLLITSQFVAGIWSALFCAPLPIMLNKADTATRASLLSCLLTTNLFASWISTVMFVVIALCTGATMASALMFAGYVGVSLLRWFARAYAYATGKPLKTMMSDIVYSATLLAGALLAGFIKSTTLDLVYGALLISVILGMLPFGRNYLAAQFTNIQLGNLHNYPMIWRLHSGWSVLGVLTTEATANAHTYIVTLVNGPGAFAPIAASALMIRPITIAMNALTEFERAQMARQIGDNRIDDAVSSVRFFRLILILAWTLTAIGIVVLLKIAPRMIFPPKYPLAFLITGAIMWMAVAAIRMLRTPESALLQAAGAFRPLAYSSCISSGVSIAAVVAILAVAGPLWSIAGILIGEAVFASWIWIQARRWHEAVNKTLANG